jgi:hypothetical protein
VQCVVDVRLRSVAVCVQSVHVVWDTHTLWRRCDAVLCVWSLTCERSQHVCDSTNVHTVKTEAPPDAHHMCLRV